MTMATIALLYMQRFAPSWLQVNRLRVGIIGLPDEWRDVRVAHLSDFHLGHSLIVEDVVRRARREAFAFAPDIIALTGDFYDDGRTTADIGLFSDWPDAHMFAVFGNHDHRGGSNHLARLARDLETSGVRVLINDSVKVPLRGRDAWIAGVDDPYTGKDDLRRTLDAIPDGEDALLLLAHAPTIVDGIPVGKIRLVLTGHTHGGQVRLLPSGRTPFLRLIHWIIREPRRNEPTVYHGVHWMRGAIISISNGLGMSQLPLRFRTRPQVTLIELVDVSDGDAACDDPRRYVENVTQESRLARWMS